MSALAAIALEDRVEIVGDGAMYTPDGRLQMIAEKVHTLPEVPMAIAGRGAVVATNGAVRLLRTALEAVTTTGRSSFETAARVLQKSVFRTMSKISFNRGGADSQSEFLIAGFADDGTPMLLGAGSYEAPGRDPWTLYPLPSPVFSGPDVSGELNAQGITIETLRRDGLAPHAIAIMQAMRTRPDVNPLAPDRPAFVGVGGFVQVVSVTPDSARSEIVHRWNDVIGELIDARA